MDNYEMIADKLREGMYESNMHKCLRDIGRLAGGCAASGRITESELAMLGDLAVSLSVNKKEGARKWREAVEFGRSDPAVSDFEFSAPDSPIDWGDVTKDDYRIVRREWLENEVVREPDKFDPCHELLRYLQGLFLPDEHVGYVTEVFERDGKLIPSKGCYYRTAGDIMKHLKKGNFDNAVDTVNEDAGAWIRFNPLDGQGVKDGNVTDLRYALVECDGIPVEQQVAIYRKLELPCRFIVHSGGKSAHAIVHIDAGTDLEEYRKRVDFLYEVCKRNGLNIDKQNRNPSRLSRMPGVVRAGHKQFIIDENTGKKNWDEWYTFVEDANDDLPDIEDATRAVRNPPPLAPELVEGILRVGHKMRIAGPSKAGKSFALLELAIAITEGAEWFGRRCRQGAVLYVNLELDTASCLNRIHAIYEAMGGNPMHADMLKIWNLRGRTLSLDRLAPKMIRRCASMGLAAIIIDPIYKTLTGDENSASEMATFCNYFDRIARDCGCAIIDCHHHSKGGQSGKKSMDRASGSGVFARDPDALLDMIELDCENARKVWSSSLECDAMAEVLEYDAPGNWRESIGEDDAIVPDRFISAIERRFPACWEAARDARARARQAVEHATAWRIEPTLREFPSFKPMNIWFNYPVHQADTGLLDDAEPADADPGDAVKKSINQNKRRYEKRFTAFKNAVEMALAGDEPYTVEQACDDLGCNPRTIERYCRKGNFSISNGQIRRGE